MHANSICLIQAMHFLLIGKSPSYRQTSQLIFTKHLLLCELYDSQTHSTLVAGNTIYLRGQCPQNLDDAVNISSNDPVEQTHKVMQNIKQLIEECGGTMQHLVKVVVYITDVRHREAVYRTMGEYIKGVHPVSTGLVVHALARPEWLVEIDATAVLTDD